jgi:hypothetical protein
MKKLLSTVLYSLVVGGIMLVCTVIILGRQLTQANPTDLFPKDAVKNYDTCKANGYELLGDYKEQCRTPDGTVFLNLQAYIATSSTETTLKEARDYKKTKTN